MQTLRGSIGITVCCNSNNKPTVSASVWHWEQAYCSRPMHSHLPSSVTSFATSTTTDCVRTPICVCLLSIAGRGLIAPRSVSSLWPYEYPSHYVSAFCLRIHLRIRSFYYHTTTVCCTVLLFKILHSERKAMHLQQKKAPAPWLLAMPSIPQQYRSWSRSGCAAGAVRCCTICEAVRTRGDFSYFLNFNQIFVCRLFDLLKKLFRGTAGTR